MLLFVSNSPRALDQCLVETGLHTLFSSLSYGLSGVADSRNIFDVSGVFQLCWGSIRPLVNTRKPQCITFAHIIVSAGTPHLCQKLRKFEYRKEPNKFLRLPDCLFGL